MLNESFVSSNSNNSNFLNSSVNFNFNLESHIVEPNFNSIIKENPFNSDMKASDHKDTTESNLFFEVNKETKTMAQSFDAIKKTNPCFEIKRIPLKIHGRNRYHRIKVKYLTNLTEIISGILEGKEEDWESKTISNSQMNLLKLILQKKFKNNGKTDFFLSNLEELKNLAEIAKFTNRVVSSKRTEENNKFVYKHTLKYLKARFNIEHNLPFNKESEEAFYKHYFENHAKERNVQIKVFYDPLNSKSESKSKTISNGHLILLFTCKKFKSDFFGYLDSAFKEDYQSSTFKKIEKLLLGLEKSLTESNGVGKEKLIKKYTNEFSLKKRVKFPWSSQEIDAAMRHFTKQVTRLLMDKDKVKGSQVTVDSKNKH